jgi:hypothetical protein
VNEEAIAPGWAAEPEKIVIIIIIIIMFYKMKNSTGHERNSFPVNTEIDSYNFDIANSEYDKQISLHTPLLWERDVRKLSLL